MYEKYKKIYCNEKALGRNWGHYGQLYLHVTILIASECDENTTSVNLLLFFYTEKFQNTFVIKVLSIFIAVLKISKL